MDFNEIKEILEMMREHDLAEFELERDNVKLRLRKNAAGHWSAAPAAPQGHYAPPMPAAAPTAVDAAAPAPADEALDLAVVKSPIVGTFYRAPEPGAPPFVDIGNEVDPDTVVCIIEVMKLMNSIPAGAKGVVSQILVTDGEPVEYGQVLMVIEPR